MPAGDGHPAIKIEVKSGAYLQTWKQTNFSNITFGRLRSRAWNPETNQTEEEPAYHGDVYVFAVLTCQDPDQLDARDLSQWDFRVLSQAKLAEFGTKSPTWNTVQRLAPVRVAWTDLGDAVRHCVDAGAPDT